MSAAGLAKTVWRLAGAARRNEYRRHPVVVGAELHLDDLASMLIRQLFDRAQQRLRQDSPIHSVRDDHTVDHQPFALFDIGHHVVGEQPPKIALGPFGGIDSAL